jgi:hypothetical protein
MKKVSSPNTASSIASRYEEVSSPNTASRCGNGWTIWYFCSKRVDQLEVISSLVQKESIEAGCLRKSTHYLKRQLMQEGQTQPSQFREMHHFQVAIIFDSDPNMTADSNLH